MTGITQAERLIRIETLLEQAAAVRNEDRSNMKETVEKIAADITSIKKDVESLKTDVHADKADLASLKNKGMGLVVGAALAGGATWEAVKAIFSGIAK